MDTVVNLGVGLDTRPYRMTLPASLSWVEVDIPKIVALKEDRLAGETPRCRLARIAADLSVDDARRAALAECVARARRAIALTEGVLTTCRSRTSRSSPTTSSRRLRSSRGSSTSARRS